VVVGYRRRHHGFHADAVTGAECATLVEPRGGGEHISAGGGTMWISRSPALWPTAGREGTNDRTIRKHLRFGRNAAVAKGKSSSAQGSAAKGTGQDLEEGHRVGGRNYQSNAAAADIEQVRGAGSPTVGARRCPAAGGVPDCRKSGCPMRPDPAITRHMARVRWHRLPRPKHGAVRRGRRLGCPYQRVC